MPGRTEERVFRDREDAGRLLAEALKDYRGQPVVVLALPRGGVPVAYPVARVLDAPMDVFLVRKLGAPMHPELGMGAITEGGVRVLDSAIVRLVGATPGQLNRVIEREEAELRRRGERYRGGRPLPDVRGKVVVLVDDGIATGGTARAALRDLRQRGPARLVLATPVSARDARMALEAEADEVVCLETPSWFHAIGEWYEDFHQLVDEDVIAWLDAARREYAARHAVVAENPGPAPAAQGPLATTPTAAGPVGGPGPAVPEPPSARSMSFRVGNVSLEADVTVPGDARGVVLFAHGSGSSRRSTRNRAVANALADAGFATVLFDLLTPSEEATDVLTGRLRFDIDLLTRRLIGVIDAASHHPDLGVLPIALFGASTGSAAALIAAAERPEQVRVVVSRGGRPDLGGDALLRVRAPVLLIVGGRDAPVLDLNRSALRALKSTSALAVVPGATHLFEEPGALEEVSRLAVAWLQRHLAGIEAPA